MPHVENRKRGVDIFVPKLMHILYTVQVPLSFLVSVLSFL